MSHSHFGDYKDHFVFENASSFFFSPKTGFVSGEILGQSFVMRIQDGMATLFLPGNDYENCLDVSLPENGGVKNTCTLDQADWIFRKLVSDWDFKPKALIPVAPFSHPATGDDFTLLTY